jgi:hypothetical protein
MHADRPGDRPRLLYWYRTAPGIGLGRSPLDEDAIRTIEEQHPDIDFDWPAILALAEVMTPEEEAPPARQPAASARKKGRGPRRDDRSRDTRAAAADEPTPEAAAVDAIEEAAEEPMVDNAPAVEMPAPSNRLVEELAGREIGSRLRARHAEIIARIENADVDGSVKHALFKRAEAIDPELWMTPEQVLEGVRNADAHYDKLRAEVGSA